MEFVTAKFARSDKALKSTGDFFFVSHPPQPAVTRIRFLPTLFAMLGWLAWGTEPRALAQDQKSEVAELTVQEMGSSHRKVKYALPSQIKPGQGSEELSSYTELATGLNYWTGKEWAETRPEWELLEGQAVVTQGPHKASVWFNLNVERAVQLTLPDGQKFESTPAILVLRDEKTGASALVAQIQTTFGELVAPNIIEFPNAFDRVKASVRFTYRRSSYEQDIILEDSEGLHAESFHMDPDHARLELWSEVYAAPEVVMAGTNVVPKVVEGDVDFGSMHIATGRAFSTDQEDEAISVLKTYGVLDGRRWLIEAVPAHSLRRLLDRLPYQGKRSDGTQARTVRGSAGPRSELMAQLRPRPSRLASLEKVAEGAARIAKRDLPNLKPADGTLVAEAKPQVVLDYIIQSTTTNLTLVANETYYVVDEVVLSGDTVIQENCVVKFPRWGYGTNQAKLKIQGPLSCSTSELRPAHFTSKDDNTLGATISGSTGSPTDYYGARALHINYTNRPAYIHDIHFRWVGTAVYVDTGSTATLIDSQITRSYRGIDNPSSVSWLKNVLAYQLVEGVSGGTNSVNRGEHVTFDQVTTLVLGGAPALNLTNSLIVAVTTNLTSYSGSQVAVLSSGTGVFESAGQGGHYLTANSVYRDSGVTNLSSDLLRSLASRTTVPPVVLPSSISWSAALAPHVPTDLAKPDYGFHYPRVDFLANEVWVSNATLDLKPGVVMAFYGGANSRGMILSQGGRLSGIGTAALPIRLLRYSGFQEEPNTTSGTNNITSFVFLTTNSPVASCSLAFAEFSTPGSDAYSIQTSPGCEVNLNATKSFGNSLRLTGGYVGITNTIFTRASIIIATSPVYNYTFRNDLFYRSGFLLSGTATNKLSIRDCILDFSANSISGNGVLDHGWNAYNSSVTNRFGPPHASDVLVAGSGLTYDRGPLSRFYQPTNSSLLNAGSVSDASTVGLYHYTSVARQTKETNSVVDIGPHVPVDSVVAKVVFVGEDNATQGTWKTVYGADGYHILQDTQSYPSYASTSTSGKSDFTWVVPTTDVRALQRATLANRIAACWYATTGFEVALALSDSVAHRVGFYCLDLDTTNRIQRIDVVDSVTGEIWDTRTVSGFNGGKYLFWDITGPVNVRVTPLAGAANAVLSGIFFDSTPSVSWDSDGDLVADHVEDINGGGTRDGTEGDWAIADTDGDGVSDALERLQGRNPFGGAVTDTTGVLDLKVFTRLK